MNYNTIKHLLDTNGEIIVNTDAGDVFELHSADVEYNDDGEQFYWDAGTSEFWLDGGCVESVEVHRSGPVSSSE